MRKSPATNAKKVLQNLLGTTTGRGVSSSPTKAHFRRLNQWPRKTEAKQSEAPRVDKTSRFNGSVVTDSYRQLALAIVPCTISRFLTRLASLASGATAGGDQRSLAAIPRSVWLSTAFRLPARPSPRLSLKVAASVSSPAARSSSLPPS